MTTKRKAELQRKLSMASMPKPPAGLAERIKADIPKYLTVETERARFSRSVSFHLRIAASILLVITSVVVAIQFIGPEEMMKGAAAPQKEAASTATYSYRDLADQKTAAAADELRVDISEEAPAGVQTASAPAVATSATSAEARRLRREEDAPSAAPQQVVAREENFVERQDATLGGVAAGAVAAEPVPATTAVAEAMAPPPPPSAAPMPAAPPSAPATTQQRSSLVKEAVAADLSMGHKRTVFGISVDPEVFHRIKNALESGQRPAPSAVNVEALVNYFAGPPARVRRNVQLDVEASPAPIGNGRRGVMRFTIDTAQEKLENGSSVPPIGTDAHIDVVFNTDAVASYRRIGSDASVARERTLLKNTSVTGLYEIELRPGIAPRARIATVRLRYKSVADGKEQTIRRDLRASDISRTWAAASRRHRLASLGAVWGETLQQGTAGSRDVAEKAEELATQEPADSRARDLALAATASSRLRSSSPTGSGR